MEKDNYSKIVKRVAGTLRLAKINQTPAAFLTGAGASISANIPSAKQLVKQATAEFSHCIDELSQDDRIDYGKCMSALSPNERRMLIKPHLDRAQINWGHIALAQIIKEGFVSRVLTFNFDLVLERALSLIGQQCPVYDFGAYPKADLALLAEPAIIHLHGQSYGFVHLNTAEETKKHKDAISPVITNTINTRPTVIIGYSGDCDPSSTTLQEKYDDQHRLTWLEFSENPNDAQKTIKATHNYAEFAGGLDFDLFMIALATELKVWPPKILKNPSAHLLEELLFVTDYPVRDDTETDFFTRTKERLGKQKDDPIVKAIFEGTALPTDASQQEREINIAVKAGVLLREGNELIKKAKLLIGNDKIKANEAAAKKFEKAITIKPDLAVAYNNWGMALIGISKHKSNKRAQALNEQAIEKFSTTIKIVTSVSMPYNNWGLALGNLAALAKTPENSEKLYKQAISKYKAAIKVDPEAAKPYNNWGSNLISSTKYKSDKQSKLLCETAIEKFEIALIHEPSFIMPLSNWGVALGKLAALKSGATTQTEFELALKKVSAAIKMAPEVSTFQFNKARVLAMKRDVKAMIGALKQAKRLGQPNLKLRILNEQDFQEHLKTKEMQIFLETMDL